MWLTFIHRRLHYKNMKIIALINQKGGVGKTTTTAHVGYALATFHEQRVLLIDYDAQSNLSQFFGIADHPAVADALQGRGFEVVAVRERLDVLASTTDFVHLERWLYDNPAALYEALAPVRERYDYILIDCPPSTNIVPETALRASTDVVIIANGEPYSLQGFATVLQFVARIQAERPRLSVSGVILTRYDKRKALSREIAAVLEEQFPDTYFRQPVREVQAVVDALASGKTVFEHKRTSLAAQDFRNLTALFHSRFTDETP